MSVDDPRDDPAWDSLSADERSERETAFVLGDPENAKRIRASIGELEKGGGTAAIDGWTRHLWHISQHNRMVIGLGGRVQRVVNEMRAAAGLEKFGWNTAFPDADFGECSVHVSGCQGQETHPVSPLR